MSTAVDNTTLTSVIAVAASHRTHGPYRAVMMKKDAAGPRLVWKTADDGRASDFKTFVERVMPAAVSPSGNGAAPAGVLGLDSADVAFYRIDVPPVGDHQLPPIVRMQAEAFLPLPADRMQIAWRAGAARDGKRRCSVAAARTDQLRALALDVKTRTSRIMLNAEAVVKAWTDLFGHAADMAVLIRLRNRDTQVILIEQRLLRHAVTVDVGLDDIDGPDAAAELELFVHDVRNALELFDREALTPMPIFAVGCDVTRSEPAVAALRRAGIDARLASPAPGRLRCEPADGAPDAVEPADVCEYLEPIGLALMALDAAPALNLFDGILGSDRTEKKRGILALILSLVAAAVITIACLFAWSAMDKAALQKLNDKELDALIEQQKTRQLIAAHRPDILEIIAILTENAPSGMLLDSFEFKQGGPVTISSYARNIEELFAFQKKLDAHKDLSAVKIVNWTPDEKQNRINFKMEFNYKQFGKK
ncbi:MAG TPA: hypothetical protein P5279_16330 [Anaerohalosphaeraceae bacterium]|nr:hypothetical protein [Anaerohalosphaeraceae bacterium]HRT52057.1 hypothetical protein [Anaerohalosphaeraceae bacterium]HRT88119.1 hypothetical protein [Anaerohalosphaeraceae bacterium]